MHQSFTRKLSQATSLTLALLLVVSALGPATADAASSWSPTLLVNTEAFQTIDAGDGTTDVELRFGASTTTLKFLYTNQKFQFSKSLSVLGNMSGSSLNVDRNATVGGTLTVTGAVTAVGATTVKGTLSGQTLRVSGNADVHGILSITGAVHADGNLSINDDADTNDVIFTFGNSTGNQSLKFLNTLQKFQFSKSLSVLGSISGSSLNVDRNATVGGTLTVSGAVTAVGATTVKGTLSGQTLRVTGNADVIGALAVTGAVRTDSNLTINDDADTNDGVFTFGNSTGNQTLKFLNTKQKFQFSKSLSILGTLSGSSLNIDQKATIGGTLTATGSITTKGALSGSTLTVDGSVTLHGITYSAPGSQGAASTFLKNDGAGNLTWGSVTVGNGSGGIISIHPEYPNAIYFSSGSSLVGQLSASGSDALNENFYHWTTTRATLQDYWIAIRVRVPDNFSSWDPVKPVEIRYKTADGVAGNNYIKVLMKDTNNAYLPALSGSMLSPSFKTSGLRGPEASGTFAAKGYFTLYVKLAALTGKFAEIGFINFNFETTTP